jgi:hypothetical protein
LDVTFSASTFSASRIEPGFFHNHNRSPYRNSALGLKRLYELWPDCDWFLYTEYDCLFTSSDFKTDLSRAATLDAWCVGFDLRRYKFQIPVLEALLACGEIRYSYFMLGCCLFFSRKLISRLHENGFIDRLLEASASFPKGTFPGYLRWAFEEELWPTVAAQLGGSLYELACFKGRDDLWHQRYINDPRMKYGEADPETPDWRGRHLRYVVRFWPKIDPTEMRPESAILHASKNLNNQ